MTGLRIALALLWWAPTILLFLVRLGGDRLRFEVVMGLARTLLAAGWPGAASRVYAVEMARAERQMAGIGKRRRW